MSGTRGKDRFGFRGVGGNMPYGPRHSSPHTLAHSPGSPNVAPIQSQAPAGPGPHLRLFGPKVSTGVAVPWGSGALPSVIPCAAKPVIKVKEPGPQGEPPSSNPDDKGDNIGHQTQSSGSFGNKNHSTTDQYHNRPHRDDHGRDKQRHRDKGPALHSDRRQGSLDNSRRRNDHSHIDSSQEDSLNYSEGKRHRWADGSNSHRGAILREDRGSSPDDRGSVSTSHHRAKLMEDFDSDNRDTDRCYGDEDNWESMRENRDRERHSERHSNSGRGYNNNRDYHNRESNRGSRDRGRGDMGSNNRDYRNTRRGDSESYRDHQDRGRNERENDRGFRDIERDSYTNYSNDERDYNYQENRREQRSHYRNERRPSKDTDDGRDSRYIDRERDDYRDKRDYSRGSQTIDRDNRHIEYSREPGGRFRDSESFDSRHSKRNEEFREDRFDHRKAEYGDEDIERRKGHDWRRTDREQHDFGRGRERRGDNVQRGRTGAVLIEQDRDKSVQNRNFNRRGNSARSHSHERDRGRVGNEIERCNERGRAGADSTEQRRDRGEAHGGERRGNSVDIHRHERDSSLQKGRRGALLLEDREDNRHVPRDERTDIGRTGAILREDRGSAPANANPDQQRSRNQPYRHYDQDRRVKSHERSLRSNDRPPRPFGSSRGSHERSLKSHGKKRPWCSEDGSWHEDKAMSDRDSWCDEMLDDLDPWKDEGSSEVDRLSDRGSVDSGEPKYKRRKVREPSEEVENRCIRSGTPTAEVEQEEESLPAWVRCSAADLYFTKDPKTGRLVTTKRMQDLEKKFEHDLVQRSTRAKAAQEPYEPKKRLEPKWQHHHKCPRAKHDHSDDDSCSSSSSSSSDSDSDSDQEEWWMEELRRKEQHPHRLHKELWHNDKGELNYGPLCRCSLKAQKTGIRHDKYPGENPAPLCDLDSNNLDKLYHYKITVSPVTNFLIKHPTLIMFDGHEYMFEGFSIFTHEKLPKLPECQVIRFYIVYTVHIIEEPAPENFSIRSLDLFTKYLFDEILELFDIDWKGPGGDNECRLFHVMPRFARPFPENGKEIMSINDVLLYLLKSSKPLISSKDLPDLLKLDHDSWQKYVDSFRYMVVTNPGKKPSSLRIDQLDKQNCESPDSSPYPLIIHHGLRPAQLSYAGDPVYKKKWREYMKFRHLLWNRAKVTAKDKEKLEEFEVDLQKIRLKCTLKREITVEISSEGFLLSGIRADICQHAMLLPILFGHIRFHKCLGYLEKSIGYEFKDKSLLQLALTHSSYKVNHGTNPDHGRNSLSNCGSRQLEFGDYKVHIKHTRKRGLNVLLRIMSKMGKKNEERSEIPHNERLEFLGDAVVEFITSTHLFYMFPYTDEGELTNYRGSLVQNAHLAVLANKLKLQDYLLYAHGPDLCHTRDLRHAMANCFEALMGALFLDGGIELADRVFSNVLFDEPELLDTWINIPKHPLQEDEPNGDRHWISNSPTLQKLLKFENDVGYEFRHIRLLAKSFTQRNIGYNHLTLGHNQRLEFLGDTIMKLISSDFLFRHFPDHHEGHLTLLRSSLVNNKTQSTVADEIGMPDFVISMQKEHQSEAMLKQKEKADLLEALLGAMYVDGNLDPCIVLCEVCFFPRLEDFIMNQEWNDPKSQLQQCCLTLRDMNDESPDIPVYKPVALPEATRVLAMYGPTNSRVYKVGVYFRDKRLAVGEGSSKQQGEMRAADNALKETRGLFHNRFWTIEKKNMERRLQEQKKASDK